jgi:hypothetical protein
MFFITMLTLIGTSSASRYGVPEMGHSALRTLMVLPTWPLARVLGWPVAAGVGGSGLLIICVVLVTRRMRMR